MAKVANKQKKKITGPRKPKPARKQKAKFPGMGVGGPMKALGVNRRDLVRVQRMLADPCNADIDLRGYTTTEGFPLKLFDTWQSAGVGSTDGYVIWFPQYHSIGAGSVALTGEQSINSFVHYGTGAPTNSAATPAGSIAQSSLRDPAWAWANSANVADARTHAACLQVRYTGSVSSSSGLVAVLSNIPMDLFVNSTYPTVDELFTQSRDIRRMDFEVHEVRHRPAEAQNRFFDSTDGPLTFNVGTTRTGESQNGVATGPRAIGFAWRGVPATSLQFTRYKVIEWKPYFVSGMPAAPIITNGTAILPEALKDLDQSAAASGFDWTSALHTALKLGKAAYQVFAPGADVPLRQLSALTL